MTTFGQTTPTVGGSNDSWGDELLDILEADENYTNRLQGCLVIADPTDSQAEYLVYHARFPFSVKRVAYQCLPSGTATLDFKINTTGIGGLTSLSATSSKQTEDATSGNSVSATDYVTVTPSSISSGVERIVVAVWGDRTDAGTNVT